MCLAYLNCFVCWNNVREEVSRFSLRTGDSETSESMFPTLLKRRDCLVGTPRYQSKMGCNNWFNGWTRIRPCFGLRLRVVPDEMFVPGSYGGYLWMGLGDTSDVVGFTAKLR